MAKKRFLILKREEERREMFYSLGEEGRDLREMAQALVKKL